MIEIFVKEKEEWLEAFSRRRSTSLSLPKMTSRHFPVENVQTCVEARENVPLENSFVLCTSGNYLRNLSETLPLSKVGDTYIEPG